MIKLALLVALGAVGFTFPLVNVCGDSMYPTYHDGELLFSHRIFNKKKLKSGDVIVYKCPTDNKVVIKRIERVDNMRETNDPLFYCLGDNRDVSYDSRYYGAIEPKRVICKVFSQRERS